MERTLHLNAFLYEVGHHEAAWRLEESDPNAVVDINHYKRLAKIAERGKMDSLFFADMLAINYDPASRPVEMLDPALMLASLAEVTEKIGLIATASTTFEEPYNIARRFATLDHISNGRAGWNVVTTRNPGAAGNLNIDELPETQDRYRRADEFLQVAKGLWAGWDENAVLADKSEGVYIDCSRLHSLNHKGEFFEVAGPLNIRRSPQGAPVIVQAGSSTAGMEFAAKHAEAIFTAQNGIADAQEFYRRLKNMAQQHGRDPESIKILPGMTTIIGGTEAEAKQLEHEVNSLVVLGYPLNQLASDTGLPVERLKLDEQLPEDIRPVDGSTPTRYAVTVNMARRENLTVRELLLRLAGGRGHHVMVGTPEQVADKVQEWFTTRASDGFNVMPAVLPSGLEAFVDHVIPILQKRALFRTEYDGSTLRDHFGLRVPPSIGAGS